MRGPRAQSHCAPRYPPSARSQTYWLTLRKPASATRFAYHCRKAVQSAPFNSFPTQARLRLPRDKLGVGSVTATASDAGKVSFYPSSRAFSNRRDFFALFSFFAFFAVLAPFFASFCFDRFDFPIGPISLISSAFGVGLGVSRIHAVERARLRMTMRRTLGAIAPQPSSRVTVRDTVSMVSPR